MIFIKTVFGPQRLRHCQDVYVEKIAATLRIVAAMLTRIEIAAAIVFAAGLWVLAGYAVVSGIMLVRPDKAVRDCVARAEAAAGPHTSGSKLAATKTCTRLIHGTNIAP
jgi:hypothetical protein